MIWGLYLVGFLVIYFILSYQTKKHYKKSGEFYDWSDVMGCFFVSLIWPLAWIVLLMVCVSINIGKFLSKRDPPKWL